MAVGVAVGVAVEVAVGMVGVANHQQQGGVTVMSTQLMRSKAMEHSEHRKLCAVIDEHNWFGMLTLRFPPSFMIEDEEHFVKKLGHMLSDRFRADRLDIGSMIKREFGKRPKKALHYHILFTSQTISDLPEKTLRLLKKAWLRSIGAKNNQSRYFDWKAPHDGAYLKKLKNGKQNVISIPRSYKGTKLSRHFFHTRNLGRTAGLGVIGQSSQDTLPSVICYQSISSSCNPVIDTFTPYWSPDQEKEVECAMSQQTASQLDADSHSDLVVPSAKKFTQNDQGEPHPVFTRSNLEIHTKSPPEVGAVFTRSCTQPICKTCEYHGRLTLVDPSNSDCLKCGNPWDICCPF